LKTAVYLCVPMPGMRRRTAVPADVSWAVPRIAEFKQCAAAASQNVTRPGETVVLTPVVTAAVSVTMVPLVTVAEESVRVVVVVAPKAKLSGRTRLPGGGPGWPVRAQRKNGCQTSDSLNGF